MSATSSISSTHSSSNSGNSGNNNSNSNPNNVISSASNIVILDNQMLDSNDVVAAAGLQQLSNAGAGGLKLTRDCTVQYSNLISSYTASSNSSGNNNHSNTTIVGGNSSPQMNTVNIIQGDATQTNSRVQVLSNVQLVSSKGASQPSTFSYVDANGKNFNVLTSTGKLSTNKLISVPITKVKTFNNIGQPHQQQQSHQQQLPSQQTQIVSSQISNQPPSQTQTTNLQKVTVPRNIQLVTRIPNSTISVSNGRVSQITPTLSATTHQQQPTPQYTIQQYPDSSGNISSSLDIRSSASGPMVNSTNASNIGKVITTKSKSATSLKMVQNSQIIQPSTTTPANKTMGGKSISVNLKSIRNNSKTSVSGVNSQYYIKSSSNGSMPPSGNTTSIYTTSPAQAVYHNPTPHPPQNQVQIPINTATGKNRSVYKTSKNQLIQIQQQQVQHQPHQSPQRSLTPSSSPVSGTIPTNVNYSGTGATTMVPGNVNNRYQNYNSYPISASQPQSSSTTSSVSSNYKQFNHLYQGAATSSSSVTFDSSGSATIAISSGGSGNHHEHPIPSVTVTGYSSSTGKNKKYASAVVNDSNNPTFVLSPVKSKGVGRGRNNSTSNYQQAEAVTYQRYSASPSRPNHQQPQQQFQSLHTSGPGQYNQQNTAVSRDDQIFLNGQQMTDESSARILQSLSQRSSEAGKYSGYKQHQQQQPFTFYGSDNVPQSPTSNVIPSGSNASSSSIVYDPSDARFYEDKHDGRRSSSSSEIITYADNIPLREGFPSSYNYNHRDDDEHIGVEVRPAPVDTSNGRYHILQAILQDHTYFASLPEVKLPESQQSPAPTTPQQTQLLHSSIPTSISHQQPPPLHHHHQNPSLQPKQQQNYQQMISSSHHQQFVQQSQSSQSLQHPTNYKQLTSLPVSVGGSSAVPPSPTSANVTVPVSGISVPLTQVNLNTLVSTSCGNADIEGSSASSVCATATVTTTTPSGVMCGKQQQAQSMIPGGALDYIYQRQSIPPQDDDANSVISTGSRNYNNMDIDLGEETETAPEGEGEDDSVTRCICDLTHDDGYMICCDKCSAWQHVDCMGIDRMNIPDEYNCEMCQPRPVDRIRARTLQMEKRKEQSLLMANNNLQIPVGDAAVTSTNLIGNAGVASVTTTSSAKGANQCTTAKVLAGSKKSKTSGGSSKKKTSEGGVVAKKATKKALDALNRVNGKRKELKKPSKKKIKTTEQNAEKMSNMIRTWIDNYERAITNHYSPELRARLQAFGKMQSQNPLLNSERLIPATTPVANLAQKCTTVPHAGGKILISTEEIEPKTPIIEIRGKYMLSSQHKPLQSLFNMAANGKLGNNKNAGPFLFLYQVTQGGMELCVDTRTYGNDARFVRRSCRPNAEILHNIEKGVVHLYVVSTTNIKANTEITIKHDENLIQRVGGVVILTHTTVTKLCACGLIKECQYSSQLSDGVLPSGNTVGSAIAATSGIQQIAQGAIAGTTTTVSKSTKSKKHNGALVDGEKKPPKKRNSRSTCSNPETRVRSISSSGDSTSEMMLYIQNQQQQQQTSLPLQHSPLPKEQPPLSPMQQVQSNFQPSTSQLVHQQLQQTAMHFMQQSQPGLMQQSQPVYMYSPSPTHQSPTSLVQPPTQFQSPVVHPPTPPPHPMPPMSPVNRPGFYTEIKSPMNSPTSLNTSGPPPLIIPTLSQSCKNLSQHPPPLQFMTDKSNSSPVASAPVNVPSLAISSPPQQTQDQARHEIQLQQLFHQQQLMEDSIKIKIKSPKVSPLKQEYSPTSTSMLSPPPPPPNPVAQRLRCAESLKQELFHSHFQSSHVRPPSPSPSPPPIIQSPVKQECSVPPEPKQEPIAIEDTPTEVKEEKPPAMMEIKSEEDIKPEILPEQSPVVKLEESVLSSVKIEETSESINDELAAIKEIKEESPMPQEQDSREDDSGSLCDSATSSPIKSQHAVCNAENSTHSSPHSTSSQHHQHSGGSSSSSKKKGNPFRETEKEKKEKPPSRKLTREERKMEAIVKAFEKMEQSQQRKQELKEQRKEGKRRSVSSSTPDEGIPSGGSSSKKKSLSSQKRKKKKSKSLSQHFGSPNQSRKKKVSKSSKKNKNARVLSMDQESSKRPYEGKAAEMLRTLSQSPEQSTKSSYFGDDVKPLAETGASNNNNNNSETIAAPNIPLLSSACMLVEAAVGPLEQASAVSTAEQDFKFPQKAKTKKSMSREWLSGQAADVFRRNTPDQDSGYISEDKSHDYRRTPFDDGGLTPLGVDVNDPGMCIVAKKVEEFIAQNSPQADETATACKWDEKLSTSSVLPNNPPDITQTPTAAGNVSESAAAKKRWLRQAISEETDELTHASSSPPPPNGFTTPLKKRRVIRQSEEATKSQTNQQQPTLLSAQKIDFADHVTPSQHTQSIVVNPHQTYPESNLQWSNSGPPPLLYPFGISETKQAMDLSKSAIPPLLVVQQQRIQPYKIVPIAQALTPLHFTDPDPMPNPLVTSLIPTSAASHVNSQHHFIAQEPRDNLRRISTPSLSGLQNDYDKQQAPPASAVAAMVPASLLPPEVPLVASEPVPQNQQQHARMDVSYPTPASVSGIPRSKGSQKYIGSPAKFESPSPSDSISSGVTETPEKDTVPSLNSSTNIANTDAEEDGDEVQSASASQLQTVESMNESNADIAAPKNDFVGPGIPVTIGDETESKGVKTTESVTTDISGDNAEMIVEDSVQENTGQQEEVQRAQHDVMDKVIEEEPIEVCQAINSTNKTIASQPDNTEDVTQDEDSRKNSLSPMMTDSAHGGTDAVENVLALNGREKKTLAAPEEDHDKNELEDLQKVIASFHSENIMNLISRNKKSKKVVSSKNSAEDSYRTNRRSTKSKSNASSKEGSLTPTASASPYEEYDAPDSFETERTESIADGRNICDAPASEPAPAPVGEVSEEMSISTLGRSYSHSSWHATENFREINDIRSYSTLRPDIPPINYNSPSTYQSKAARELLSSLSVGSEPLSSFTSYRSTSSSFLDYPKPSVGVSTTVTSNSSTSSFQYRSSNDINNLLEKGFTSSRPSSFSLLGSERSSDRVGSSYLLSSTKVTDNLSTLGSTGSSYPKIFTKTASSDPRLNPALTTPEPPAAITPKRKLSINEYRQRKMQSCSTSSTATAAASTTASATTPDLSCAVSTANACSNSSSSESGGSNQISSSLGSSDVSSSISKELELELGDEQSAPVEDSNSTSPSVEMASGTTTVALTGTSEPSSTDSTV